MKISKPDVFNWCKLSQSQTELEGQGVSYVEGLKMLYAQDNGGKFHIGIDAFILIWKQLSGWKWLSKFIALPIIYQFGKIVYRIFANWRFNRLNHCVIETKK